MLGFPGIRRTNPDYYALEMMNLILGRLGLYGRLGKSVREDQGLAYYAYSGFEAGFGPGPWAVPRGGQPGQRAPGGAQHPGRDGAHPARAGQRAGTGAGQRYLTGTLPLRLETNSGLARQILEIELFDLGWDYIQRFPGIISSLTVEDVQRAAQTYLHPDRYVLAIAGPELPAATPRRRAAASATVLAPPDETSVARACWRWRTLAARAVAHRGGPPEACRALSPARPAAPRPARRRRGGPPGAQRGRVAGLVGDDPFGRYLVARAGRLRRRYPLCRRPPARAHARRLCQPRRWRTPDGPDASGSGRLAGAGTAPRAQMLFYREGGADRLLESRPGCRREAIRRARVLVGSGVSLASSLPAPRCTPRFAQAAAAGAAVAFDVNWRPALWQYPERARDLYHAVLPQVDILMLSSQELIMLTGGVASTEEGRLEAILQRLDRAAGGRAHPPAAGRADARPGGMQLRPVAAGRARASGSSHLPACDIAGEGPQRRGRRFPGRAAGGAARPPGAGCGAGRGGRRAWARLDLGRLDVDAVAEIFAWANASGALATTRRGALAALPGRNTVLRLIKGRRVQRALVAASRAAG